ncbi:MAG: YbaK/EbsC family protein [Pseudomonadota bacterium]|nr:MAG: YbaK/EbsC family protein [Pseudomonadota bacterium]
MPIAKTVEQLLQQRVVPYAVVPHPHAETSRDSAKSAHIPPERLAKAVVLADAKGFVMAVVPADRHVGVDRLSQRLGRQLKLVDESRIAPIFKDCDVGAIPPLGMAYGMETVVDDSLVGQPEIYFEAGDHEDLVCVSGEQFLALLKEAQHVAFSH